MTAPAFILATDLLPNHPDWPPALAQAESLSEPVARILGFAPRVRLASLPTHPGEDAGAQALHRILEDESQASESFVLPASLDWNLWQREAFGRTIAEFRRAHANALVFHDDADPCHPLLVECLAQTFMQAIAGRSIRPQRTGLLLTGSGHGDSGSRAQSYRLMRLVWEQLSLARADVAFVRHAQPFLCTALERCAQEPLDWVLLPQSQWGTEHVDYARTILENFQRGNPVAAGWLIAEPPGAHPALEAWFTQRMTRLWQQRRRQDSARAHSAKSNPADCAARFWTGSAWDAAPGSPKAFIARAANRDALRAALEQVIPASDTYLVKVTWHGYATGTYTDPAALDLLLSALPGRAVVLEGHTSSRNLGGVDWDWATEARQHRAWIKQQDMEYLRRTGLADVIAHHRAEYLNVTEAYWDDASVPSSAIVALLRERGIQLQHPELAGFVPQALLPWRGVPFLSFARFKGPTRLGISNLFGLIPEPLRTEWHGANITHFASVCCDLAKLYGVLFPTFGVVEALHSAVRWDGKGLYRSRWGNYDVVLSDGIVAVSDGLAGADVLASRLQGQDVKRSGFFDVVAHELGWPEAATAILPVDLQVALA